MEANNAVVVVSSGTGDGRIIGTPAGQQDWRMTVISPLVAIAIRALKTYLQTLVGIMGASVTGAAANVLPAGDFFGTLKIAAGLSVGAAIMSALTNISAYLTDLGDKFPSLKI